MTRGEIGQWQGVLELHSRSSWQLPRQLTSQSPLLYAELVVQENQVSASGYSRHHDSKQEPHEFVYSTCLRNLPVVPGNAVSEGLADSVSRRDKSGPGLIPEDQLPGQHG